MTSSTDATSSDSARPARPPRPAAERRVRPDRPRSEAPVAPRERTGRPVRRKSEGQWALGYREPLNPNEQNKKDDNPLNVRARIENIYSKAGFDSIDKSDLRGRFRWWGLYTQREEGYDGTWTGDENIDILEAKYFMMRVRCDAGALDARQLRTIGEISTEFGRDTADLSDRENVQYHWIEIENVPEIWRRLEEVGLHTTEACGDCPRVILGSPLAGESFGEILDPTPAIDEIVKRYIGDKRYSNLPRKFKTAISGQQDVVHEINDVAFIGVEHPEHGPGLDVWVGGGLSTNPMLAQRLGAWVPLDEVPDVWEAIVALYRDYGYRRLRTKARIKFLVKDWGIEKFREVLETEYLKRKLVDGPAPERPARPIDHIGVQKLRNGLNAVGFSPIAGRVSGTILQQVADAVERVGSDRVRFTPYQKLIVLDVADDKVDQLIDELAPLGLHARPSHWRRNLLACSGIEFCKLSFVETRKRSQVLAPELEQRLADINADLDVPITININGCPNSCGRSQIADIGFKGQLVDDGDGNQVEGFQVHLGGSLGLDSGFGRKLRQHKVTSAELGDYIERVVRNFVKNRDGEERFAQWAVRADEADLR
ncbi:nitrite/sulfite reductase [Nocardia sp. CC227C]|uniref:nitrite/sulfite reductase n=1 Tax=Nocardia sp. CC227C TaxID=3044562 RepID=UPI00278BD8E4|nr:nitrite/sulfite reductase [Nocardia sp. CC227C]